MDWINGINELTFLLHPEENYEIWKGMIPDEETNVDHINDVKVVSTWW